MRKKGPKRRIEHRRDIAKNTNSQNYANPPNHFFMASPASSQRRFERLNHAMHERLSFSTVKISHSLSTVFDVSVHSRSDRRRVLAEFEANGEN